MDEPHHLHHHKHPHRHKPHNHNEVSIVQEDRMPELPPNPMIDLIKQESDATLRATAPSTILSNSLIKVSS